MKKINYHLTINILNNIKAKLPKDDDFVRMEELFDSEVGYMLVTEELKKQWEILQKLNIKLITWVNKGCAGEIVESPGKGDLIKRFYTLNKNNLVFIIKQ